jgi:hypothetical protein
MKIEWDPKKGKNAAKIDCTRLFRNNHYSLDVPSAPHLTTKGRTFLYSGVTKFGFSLGNLPERTKCDTERELVFGYVSEYYWPPHY